MWSTATFQICQRCAWMQLPLLLYWKKCISCQKITKESFKAAELVLGSCTYAPKAEVIFLFFTSSVHTHTHTAEQPAQQQFPCLVKKIEPKHRYGNQMSEAAADMWFRNGRNTRTQACTKTQKGIHKKMHGLAGTGMNGRRVEIIHGIKAHLTDVIHYVGQRLIIFAVHSILNIEPTDRGFDTNSSFI